MWSSRASALILALVALIIAISPEYAMGADASTRVLVVSIDDTITDATVENVKSAINHAGSGGYECIIITLNTPGGGLDETFEIINIIESSPVPVIGYVYPSGASAVSAGTFILMSTHVAAMASHTIIGSCQPVELTSSGVRYVNETKIINYLVKYMEERAKMHGRNATIASMFITKNLDINDTEALNYGVIEFSEDGINSLLLAMNGYTIKFHGTNYTFHTAGASIEHYRMPPSVVILNFLSNPIIASLLLIIGIYALIFGLATPGHGAEVVGVVMIALALMGLGFQINILSLFILALGIVLLLIEIHTPGFGVFGIVGIFCIIIGTMFIIPVGYPRWMLPKDVVKLLIFLAIFPAVLVGIFFAFLLFKTLQIVRKKPVVGGILGTAGTAAEDFGGDREGFVIIDGEYWKAVSADEVKKGDRVVVREKDGVRLVVEKVHDESRNSGEKGDTSFLDKLLNILKRL
ncbi:MAG: nodulation protein NfeD [Thermoplasmata archaeon]|nr:MAG: nodulation protein NfeD [Thermoplasmata archaeon]